MTRHVPRMDDAESRAWLGLVSVLELLPPALDAQMQRDAGITHFEYVVLSMLQLAPERTLRMKQLASVTNATLPRLSHVATRLERRGLLERIPCPEDGRATNARITPDGRRTVIRATPGHVALVREVVLDAIGRDGLAGFTEATRGIVNRLDTDGVYTAALTAATLGQGDPPD